MTSLQRHDLLELTAAARTRLGGLILQSGHARARDMAEVFRTKNIPAIVRRKSDGDGDGIGIGISLPLREGPERLRFSASLLPQEIVVSHSPFSMLERVFPARAMPLRVLAMLANRLPLAPGRLGVFGACALQIMSGQDYLHADSDLDLVIRDTALPVLQQANVMLQEYEKETGIRIDTEVSTPLGGVKLKELCSPARTVLAKSLHSVELIDKTEITQTLPGSCSHLGQA